MHKLQIICLLNAHMRCRHTPTELFSTVTHCDLVTKVVGLFFISPKINWAANCSKQIFSKFPEVLNTKHTFCIQPNITLLENTGKSPEIFFCWDLFEHVREVSLKVNISPQWLISEFQWAEELHTLRLPGACRCVLIRLVSSCLPNGCTHALQRTHARERRWSIKLIRVCFDRISIGSEERLYHLGQQPDEVQLQYNSSCLPPAHWSSYFL